MGSPPVSDGSPPIATHGLPAGIREVSGRTEFTSTDEFGRGVGDAARGGAAHACRPCAYSLSQWRAIGWLAARSASM